MQEWFVEMGGACVSDTGTYFKRNIVIPPEQIEKIRSDFNNTDVYRTAYIYSCRNVDEALIKGPLYIDLDIEMEDENDYNLVHRDLLLAISYLNTEYKIPYEYMQIYFSGSKGFHLIVDNKVIGVQECKDLNLYYKIIAQDVNMHTICKTVDTRIYDNKRLLRLPNSINSKSGLYKVPISIDKARVITYTELLDYASDKKEVEYPEPKIILPAAARFRKLAMEFEESKKVKRSSEILYKGELLPCIKNILESGTTKGYRNNVTAVVASALFQNGATYEEIYNIISEWNENKVRPKMAEREMINTINSMNSFFQEKRGYGCNAIRDLGFCIGKDCKVFTSKNGGC